MLIKLAQDVNKESLHSSIQSDESVELQGELTNKFVILKAKNNNSISIETVANYKQNPNVVSAIHMLEYEGKTQGLIDEFIVKLKANTGLRQVQDLVAAYQCSMEEDQFVENQFLISVNKTSSFNSLQLANLFQETDLFEFAEPNFFLENICVSNEPLYGDQWALNNTGQFGGTVGVDIKIEQAWSITQGSPSIRIAVVDDGVDLDHPDLAPNLLIGYDATGSGTVGGPLPGENHGTACAGTIAAVKDNGIGIAGVAPNCRIHPVHVTFDTNLTIQWIAAGISWASYSGGGNVDVISNSWGGGTPSTAIINAINNATTFGRGGKGCVVVLSSCNDNASIVPAYAALPNVISVGAISPCGQRKSPSSCDGENWGSNYGEALSVVAPGVLIPTTDRQGSAGYVPGDYRMDFGGTSAACPHVAGVAALLLSVNPNLTHTQVKHVIESTAQKVGDYTYTTTSAHPNGSWNENVGYGLVNADLATRMASAQIIGIMDTTCDPCTTFTLSNYSAFPEGSTVTWTNSPNIPSSSITVLTDSTIMVCTPTGATHNNEYWIGATITANGMTYAIPHKIFHINVPPLAEWIGSVISQREDYYLPQNEAFLDGLTYSSGDVIYYDDYRGIINSDWDYQSPMTINEISTYGYEEGDELDQDYGDSQFTRYLFPGTLINGHAYVKARLENHCGWSDWAIIDYSVFSTGTGTGTGTGGGDKEDTDDEEEEEEAPGDPCCCEECNAANCIQCIIQQRSPFSTTTTSSGIQFTYSPNPTSSILTITLIALPQDTTSQSSYGGSNSTMKVCTIQLLTGNGEEVYGTTVNYSDNDIPTDAIEINVTNLSAGTYYLHITAEGNTEQRQIFVN
ncbi:hypothetical protein FACS1894201_03460 [Bacteroidia bacterium]|nr:hypothetical protein FACS1894201_03460 [Bacteroidia bacterium]